jgi:1,4-alpha-glucan branching enzyme
MDFPREGNGNSFAHARRQFNLVDDKLLRYRYLWEFDVAMNHLEDTYKWLQAPQAYVSLKNESDKVIVFERAGLVFIFNCRSLYLLYRWRSVHPTNSYTDYRIGVDAPGEYKVILSSDEKKFGGHERIDLNGRYFTTPMEWNGRNNWVQVRESWGACWHHQVYSPCRTVLVLGL